MKLKKGEAMSKYEILCRVVGKSEWFNDRFGDGNEFDSYEEADQALDELIGIYEIAYDEDGEEIKLEYAIEEILTNDDKVMG